MAGTNPLQVKADRYVSEKLREVRGDEPRTSFGKKIGLSETQIYQYESFRNKVSFGRLVMIARIIGLPLDHFAIPDSLLHETDNEKELNRA